MKTVFLRQLMYIIIKHFTMKHKHSHPLSPNTKLMMYFVLPFRWFDYRVPSSGADVTRSTLYWGEGGNLKHL